MDRLSDGPETAARPKKTRRSTEFGTTTRSSLVDVLPNLFGLLVFGLGSAGLFLAGVHIEWFVSVTFEQGNVEIAVWVIVMGAMALYFVYNVGIDKVCPKF